MDSLSKDEFRAFMVRYHFLDNSVLLSGKRGIKKLLRRIGSVQYDPLNIVGRNPDLVFQSRISGYTMGLLDELLYRERSLVDGWDKEMSIYLSQDWPNFSRIRQRREEGTRRTLRRRGQEEVLSYLPQVIDEIKNRGPLGARDIKFGACKNKGRWGHRQISGAALDYLHAAGELGIYKKRNAQKIYDLNAHLIPEKIRETKDPCISDDDFFEWYFSRRIGSIGAYWSRNGSGWLGDYLCDPMLRQRILKSLEEKNLIVPLKIPELSETFYIRRKDISILNEKNKYDEAVRILAPLDNMLWDRLFIQKVFDFEYSWEVYVPQEKRKYGYYVLPVLYRNNLIARLEPVKHEKGKPFRIKNWWWESGCGQAVGSAYREGRFKMSPELKEAVVKGLENFACYLEVDGIDKDSLWKYLE